MTDLSVIQQLLLNERKQQDVSIRLLQMTKNILFAFFLTTLNKSYVSSKKLSFFRVTSRSMEISFDLYTH